MFFSLMFSTSEGNSIILSTLCTAEVVAEADEEIFELMIDAVAKGGPPEGVIDEIVVIDVGIEEYRGTSWTSKSTVFV